MLERIKTSLCHPKYVGLFFKDKFYRVILLILFFFILFAGTIVTKCMLTDQFGSEQAFAVQKIVQYSTDSSGNKLVVNISFDAEENKIKGTKMNFKSDEAVIGFLTDNTPSSQNVLSIYFQEDEYTIYYGYYKLGYGDYTNKDLKSFDIAKVQAGDTVNCANFRAFLINIFDNVQYQEAAVISVQAIISNFVYYIFVIILCLISSYFLNPAIQFNVRIKLVLYDSLTYFYWYIIAALISVTWLEYVALIVPFIFTNITFAHIRRIR